MSHAKPLKEKAGDRLEEGHPGYEVVDPVFGEITEDGPDYRGVSAVGAWVLLTKTNLGLGVLGIPSVFQLVGIVPGIIIILVIQTLVAYAASVIGPFKLKHPEVYGLADAGYVWGGRWVKEFLYFAFWINLVMVHASALVSISIALNAISLHATCTVVFMVVGLVVSVLFGAIRTLSHVTWVGWAGLISLVASVLTLTIAVGVQSRPAAAPQWPEPWTKEIKVFNTPTFANGMNAVATVVFSYGATPTYFNIVSEMRDPRKYNRALLGSIAFITALYLIIGGVVYHYCGQFVASPALGSAGPLMKRVCYGLSLPALIASICLFANIIAKHLFVRILKGSRHLTANTVTHWSWWLGCVFFSSTIAYVIGSAIPNFGDIISFIGGLTVPITAILPYNFMWWHDNWRYATAEERRQTRRRLLLLVNILIQIAGWFIIGAGTYASVKGLIKSSSQVGPFTCADNSNSTPQK